MAFTIKKNTVDISSMVKWDSIDLNLITTKQVSTLNFDIQNVTGRTMPAVGDTIDMYDGATHLFGGKITERVLKIDGGILSRYSFSCVDWSFDFDKTSVVKSYTNTDPGTIVADIISTFTTGFTGTNVALAGFTIPSISFNYQPPTKCLQKIASLIGFDWYIDPNKDVHFFNSDNVLAPFNLTDTAGNHMFHTLALETNLQNLKNSVFVIGGDYKYTYNATTTPDIYATDATALIYPLAYSYDPATVQVTLDGTSKTVGVDQKDTFASYQVLYNAGQNNVGAFIRIQTAFGAAHTVKIFGDATIPVLGHAVDSASITTYGEYQDAIVDKLITTVSEAQKRAQAEIFQYGQPNYVLRFKTLSTGLMIGQTITLNSSLLAVSGTFTIKQISVRAQTHAELMYDVQAEASISVNFNDIMTLLLESELMQNQVPNSVILEVLLTITESLTLSDALSNSTSSPPYKWNTGTTTLTWGFGTWG